MPDRMPVRFTGNHGSGPLMWGQIAIWDVFAWLPPDEWHTLNLIRRIEVPPGTTLDTVHDALRALLERHDVLHSRWHPGEPDPTQTVEAEGEVAVELIETTDLDGTADQTAARLLAAPFDHAADQPVRIAVLTGDGQPRLIVMVVSHMAVDGWSIQIVADDLRELLRDPTGGTLEPAAQQPLARAAQEQGDLARQRQERALAFWAKHLTTMPAALLTPAPSTPDTRLDWAEIRSPALALAARVLARRNGLSDSQVVLAGAGLLLALHTGSDGAGLRVLVATRFQPQSRRLVGAFNQNALFRVDVPDTGTAGDYFRHAGAAALAASRNSEYHPRRLEELVARIAAQRGIEVGGYCFFNDVRYDAAPATDDLPDGDELTDRLAKAQAATELIRLDDTRTQMTSKFFLFLKELGDRAVLQLSAHPAFLAPRAATDALGDLERMLVLAAADDTLTIAALRREFGAQP